MTAKKTKTPLAVKAEAVGRTVPWATLGLWVVFVIVAVAGAVLVCLDRADLSFEEYIALLTGLGVAFGLLGIGRGIASKKPDG